MEENCETQLYKCNQLSFAQQNNAPVVISMRNALKYYTKTAPVIKNLNLTVKRGKIYSLLGSSGCGKSTIISCIVGTKKLNEGDIFIFGTTPGLNGKKIGYMPQENALYPDFSVKEMLLYFGMLNGMGAAAVLRKTDFLVQLLRLPDISRRIRTLSGGQKRRVSFAVALIHDAELLILDEPTSGVDPLIRVQIWKHLVHLSVRQGTTVLITTHYIAETRNSTMIGIMRNGRLIAEQTPATLLYRFNAVSLETVVTQLCREDNDKVANIKYLDYRDDRNINNISTQVTSKGEESTGELLASTKRIRSLIHKNVTFMFRNLLLSFFSVLMPAVIIFVMCMTYKNDPNNLKFGVVNNEIANLSECMSLATRTSGECNIENLSCKFLKHIPSSTVVLQDFGTEEDASNAVRTGSIWGYLIFHEDYSKTFFERFNSGVDVDERVLNHSEIIVKMDQTVKIVVNRIKKSFTDGFQDFVSSMLTNCGLDERIGKLSLNYNTPVFGTIHTKFINYIAPNLTVGWLFFFPIVAASIRLINEKKQGTYERSIVAGTRPWEIFFAYGSTECIVLVLQSIMAHFIINVIVGVNVVGSHSLAMILYLMNGFAGVSFGLFLGSLCNEEIEAALIAMAFFFPNCFISGNVWPIEGMPIFMQYFAYALPCTLSGEAMRSIYNRGWDLSHLNVWLGFASLLVETILFFVLTVLVQKFKNK